MEPRRKYITGIYHAVSDLNWKDEATFKDRHEVYFEDRSLIIDKNQPGLFFSTDFDWGSSSIGTKQLAVSILLELTNAYEAIRYADLLIKECLSLLPSHNSFSVQIYALQRWLKSKKGLPDQETDLLFWTKIEEPDRRKPWMLEPPKKPPVILPPPISERIIETQKGGNHMSGVREASEKYPFSKLEVGQYFYLLNPSPEEEKRIRNAMWAHANRYGKTMVKRIVTAQWAREHKIEVAQDDAKVMMIIRTA
jgi:hypothetical protein